MIKIMDKVIGWMMVLLAIITLWAVLTPNHLYVG
ncbi:hypothetical protein Nitsa_1934 [Nitratifractor salsuginis DSM 16511]|jgi:hypothetical protein|uniref:Uncharacterized protein n=1 Tax=Nitratifractor salsuginis (strain DSM 16511 / JCM 12458 / E9I37-1) TaxID=749222 RepID=E6X2H2_NITSE|nr:hypothetical protein Nitsa_1934 [Nitratifractor salsuginis DSM 16511]